MSKLHYYYGTMNAAKSATALMQNYGYLERGLKTLFMKSCIDTRDQEGYITSRIGLKAKAVIFDPSEDLVELASKHQYDVVIVDECQFCTPKQIEQLKNISAAVPVFVYGLKTDYRTKLFPASARLFEIADVFTELESVCRCGKKAIINARKKDGKIVYGGDNVIDIGGNEKYEALCWECYQKERTHGKI